MARNKAKDTVADVEVCKGIELSRTFFETKENRLLTLLIKGFIVYLLSMGSLGFYLSAFKIEYNVLACHVCIFVMAIICAMLYYRLLVENTGYLLLLIVFMFLVYQFRIYINSGFYAIVNITVDNAAQYLDVDIQRLYNEQIGNRYITVTCATLFIGIVLDIILNVYISRRMQYVTAILIVMGLNLIPLYLVSEPDMLYVIMMLGGIAMAICYKSGKHYSPQVSVKRNNQKYSVRGRKKEIAYVYDVKAMLQAGAIAMCFAIVMINVVSVFKPKESFNVGYEGNKYKKLTMAAASTLLVDGISGFFNKGDTIGGMKSGKLGDVSTVYLDYQTDLVLEITPYNYDTVYLKSFTGVMYNAYENNWTSIDINREYDDWQATEAKALREAYLNDEPNTSKGIMRINNVGGLPNVIYRPYYYCPDEYENEKGKDIMGYYPRLEGNNVLITSENYKENAPYTKYDLMVPQENVEAVEKIVEQLDVSGTDEEIVDELINYYQENIPYTVRPGKTPHKTDFVNYFLLDNKKGYCAHFASAAVLIFRYLGIPARYIEGYAVSYNQILEGELVEDAEYSDYYDGYSEIGKTALIEVNVTDADAHAWVEIYTEGKGWHVVEVTPSASGEEEMAEDFWTMFDNIMGDGDNNAEIEEEQGNNFVIPDELIRQIIVRLLLIMLFAVMTVILLKCGKYIIIGIKFMRSGTNDRLIIKYSLYRKKMAKRDKQFAQKLNYREQLEYLNVPENYRDKLITVLEQAGFSNREISESDYNMVVDWMKQKNRY